MSGSLEDRFTSMDWPRHPSSFTLYQEWKEKRKHTEKEKAKGDDSGADQLTVSVTDDTSAALSRLGELLKEKEALLVEILCSAAFSFEDSKKIIDLMIRQVEYFSSRIKNKFWCKKKPHKVRLDSSQWSWDLPVFGQILAPVLASNLGFLIVIDAQDIFLDFYTAIIELVMKAGYTDSDSIIRLETVPNLPSKERDYFCPMIVYEESDLDSAVECIIHAAWDYSGKLSWSLTHVFVQESVFRQVIDKLKLKLDTLEHGSRFCQSTDLCEIPDFEDKRDFAKLEVYPEDRKCCHRLFVGWDPSLSEERAVREEYRGCGISVLPFRTETEALEMANSRPAFAVSVWSQMIAHVASAQAALKMTPTVWINCYGVIDPSVPFGTGTAFDYHRNGEELLHRLTFCCSRYPYQDIPSYAPSELQDAINKAKVAASSWSAVDSRTRCHTIAAALINNSIKSAISYRSTEVAMRLEEDALFDCVQRWSSADNTAQLKMVGNYGVRLTGKPAEVVFIYVCCDYPRLEEDLVLNMSYALAKGSSVIVLYYDRVLELDNVKQLCQLFKQGLPCELVFDRVVHYPCQKEYVIYLCPSSSVTPELSIQNVCLTVEKRATWLPGLTI